MYRIVLIDDEPLILAGIASLINWEDYGCSIIGKATVATEARQMILNLQPDIVITDIRMPVLDGLQLVESCKKEGGCFCFYCAHQSGGIQPGQKSLVPWSCGLSGKTGLKAGKPGRIPGKGQKAKQPFIEKPLSGRIRSIIPWL